MAQSKQVRRREPCTVCGRKIEFMWTPGPVPLGHPVLSDHGYIMCGACKKKGSCPACVQQRAAAPLNVQSDVHSDKRWAVPVDPSEGYRWLVPSARPGIPQGHGTLDPPEGLEWE
jgi:hypothetical protein